MVGVNAGVQLAQEGDGLEVLASTVPIRDPFTRQSRIVEVEHGSDGVDAQPVGVVRAEPVLGRGGQEAAHFVPAVVEDQALPVGMEPEAGVGVLEEVRAVELGQREAVLGEVGRDPIENDADPCPVQLVDERHQTLGVPEPTGGREVPRGLISPRAVERVFHDGEELDVGEPAPPDVLDERLRQALVAEEALGTAALPTPASQVDLVDRHGGAEGHAPAPRGHPLGVMPLVREVPQDRAGPRWHLRAMREGVGLVEEMALLARDGELVDLSDPRCWDDHLPDTGVTEGLQRIGGLVPEVEVPDDADRSRVRRPDGEACAVLAGRDGRPGASRGCGACPR